MKSDTLPLVFYGAGELASQIMETLRNKGMNPVCFCDTDIDKHGTVYLGITVMSFEQAREKYGDFNIYVTVGLGIINEVFDYLLKQGIKKERIINYDETLIDRTGDLKQLNTYFVNNILNNMNLDQAMSSVVGGQAEYIGTIEVSILRYNGLKPHHYIIDVGCGSGRLAKPLSECHPGKYLGSDIVDELVYYAREKIQRPDWRFEAVEYIYIPEKDSCADMVCFFSVFTHLLHEQSYWYLEEAVRVIKPGGKIIFSFLEFRESCHWRVFIKTLRCTKARANVPINVFISREAIEVWAKHLGLTIEAFYDAQDNPWKTGNLGQSLCVLSIPER